MQTSNLLIIIIIFMRVLWSKWNFRFSYNKILLFNESLISADLSYFTLSDNLVWKLSQKKKSTKNSVCSASVLMMTTTSNNNRESNRRKSFLTYKDRFFISFFLRTVYGCSIHWKVSLYLPFFLSYAQQRLIIASFSFKLFNSKTIPVFFTLSHIAVSIFSDFSAWA